MLSWILNWLVVGQATLQRRLMNALTNKVGEGSCARQDQPLRLQNQRMVSALMAGQRALLVRWRRGAGRPAQIVHASGGSSSWQPR